MSLRRAVRSIAATAESVAGQQSRRMGGHASGPNVTAKADRFQGQWGPEGNPEMGKVLAAKEADTWKNMTYVCVPIACALGECFLGVIIAVPPVMPRFPPPRAPGDSASGPTRVVEVFLGRCRRRRLRHGQAHSSPPPRRGEALRDPLPQDQEQGVPLVSAKIRPNT